MCIFERGRPPGLPDVSRCGAGPLSWCVASVLALCLPAGELHAQTAVAQAVELPPVIVEGGTLAKPKVTAPKATAAADDSGAAVKPKKKKTAASKKSGAAGSAAAP